MAERDETMLPSSLLGFLHVAFLKRLSLIPFLDRGARRRAIEAFRQVTTEREVREYIYTTRLELRRLKRSSRKQSTEPPPGEQKKEHGGH